MYFGDPTDTQSTWRELAEALMNATRAERRYGRDSRPHQAACRRYLAALAAYQGAAGRAADAACRAAGY